MAQKVIVIGAGIAGMATAARLAAQGFRVIVVEKNETYGGKLGLLQKDGFTWDTGPSLFTQPHLVEELFKDCGSELKYFLKYSRVAEGTKYFWDDGTVLSMPFDKTALSKEIESVLGIPFASVKRYLEDAAKLYESIGSIFLDHSLQKPSTWHPRRILPALRFLKPAYLTCSLHKYNKRRLKSEKLVQVFDRMATYNGSNPWECPAMMSTISHLEFNEGAFYPEGGMRNIVKAMYELCCRLGVNFRFGEDVKTIKKEGDRVTGIVTTKVTLTSDVVVSNSDVVNTYRHLLQDVPLGLQQEKLERSSSGFVFYWGMKKKYPALQLHNIFFATDYKKEFEAIFQQRDEMPEDLTVYLNISSKMTLEHAPEGYENWFLLVNAPGLNSLNELQWKEEMVRKIILKKLNAILKTDLSEDIISESVMTPKGIATNTNSYLGALYGTASNARMSAFLRHSNGQTKYKGLYFAGGTVHPGGGIPLCLRSGKIAAEMIMEKSK